MATTSEIHIGARFGRWTVISEPFAAAPQPNGKRARKVKVRCDCGTESAVHVAGLGGPTQSCGCLLSDLVRERSTRHGMHKTPEYQAWAGMKGRCTNPKRKSWNDYGGRGITICDRWLHSFEAFLADVGPRPSERHSIDRIDVDGNYEPKNVRWATWSEQLRNQRRTKLTAEQVAEIKRHLQLGDRTQGDIADEYGVSTKHISAIKRGKSWPDIAAASF